MKIGPFTFTRDSALWWWGILGAIITGLAMNLDAFPWLSDTARHWISFAAFVVGIVSGKMASSPAPSSGEVARGFRDNGRPIVLLLALGLSAAMLTGCAALASGRHRATVSVVSAHAVLSAVQDGEALLVCGRPTAPPAPRCVSADAHRAISAKLVTAFDYDMKVAAVVRAAPANASSADVAGMLGQVQALIDAIFKLIPESPDRQALAVKVGAR